MNRYGHCASTETIRRIDMSLKATINDKKNVVPDGIRKLPFLSTDTALDNFGINLETPPDKDTIHHTYGICYQKNVVGDLGIKVEVPLEKTNQKRRFQKFLNQQRLKQNHIEKEKTKFAIRFPSN